MTTCIPCEGRVDAKVREHGAAIGVGVAGDEHELVAVGAEGLGHEDNVPGGVAANEGVQHCLDVTKLSSVQVGSMHEDEL